MNDIPIWLSLIFSLVCLLLGYFKGKHDYKPKKIDRSCYYLKGCGMRIGGSQCELYNPKECNNYTPKDYYEN